MSKTLLASGCPGCHYYTTEDPEASDTKKYSNGTTTDESKLRTAAVLASWISGIFSLSSGLAAIVLSQSGYSQSLFGYGLDGILDSLSSFVVLWRFRESATSPHTEARERKACVVISLLLFVSAFSLIIKSAKTIACDCMSDNLAEIENEEIMIVSFSLCCGVIALVLAVWRVYLGLRLNSRVLIMDSIITFVGAAISFLGVLGLELYTSDEDVWYLDAMFGMFCGAFLFVFGLKLLIQMTCLYKVKEDKVEHLESKP